MKSITKPVLFLSLASLFADIASETVYPLLPIFLTGVLGASVSWLGLIEGVAEAVASISKMISGSISDRLQRQKPFVIIGYALSSIRSVIGLSTQTYQVMGIRVIDRIGKGIRTAPRDAWLAKNASPNTRGKVFGFHRSMDNLGATIAPLLAAGFLYFLPGQLRLLFLLTAIPGIVSIYFVYLAIRASPPEKNSANKGQEIEWKAILKMPRVFYKYLFVFSVFALAASADSFLILKLHDVGLPIALIPIVWAALNAVKSGASLWGGGVSDRIGAKKTLLVGWMLYAACYAVFSTSSSILFLVITFLIYGISSGFIEAPEKVLVSNFSHARSRGSAFGLFHLATGLALLPANLVVGWLWQRQGSQTALGFSAAMAGVASLGLFFLNRQHSDEL